MPVCINITSERQPVAVRALSVMISGKIADAEPGLKNELILVLDELLPFTKAGLRTAVRNETRLLRASVQ